MVVLVMAALLIHSPPAYGKFALTDPRPGLQVAVVRALPSGVFELSAVRNVRLFFKHPELLLMSLGALHDHLRREVY